MDRDKKKPEREFTVIRHNLMVEATAPKRPKPVDTNTSD